MKSIFVDREDVESLEELDEKDKEKAKIREQLQSIKIYRPWFIFGITVLQAIGTIALLIVGGVTEIGILPIQKLSSK